MWSGRTRQNKLLHFAPSRPGDAGDLTASAGDLVDVRVTSAAPHFLRGELMRIVRPGRRRRVRIPVVAV
jgi:hypothetical protein